MPRLRHYLLIALLLIVPVQGMAAVLHAITCAPHAAAKQAVEHDGHDHASVDGAVHDQGTKHSHDSTSGSGDTAQHQCCHHYSAAPVVHVTPAAADLPVHQSSLAVPEITFVLEQPQRPPRA